MLLALSTYAMPEGRASWSEEPWTKATEGAQEKGASTLSDPIYFNLSGNEPQSIRLGSGN